MEDGDLIRAEQSQHQPVTGVFIFLVLSLLILAEFLFQETFSITVHGRVVAIDTEVPGDIVAVQLKAGDKRQRAETLKTKAY